MKKFKLWQPLLVEAFNEFDARRIYEDLMTLNPTAQYDSNQVIVQEVQNLQT